LLADAFHQPVVVHVVSLKRIRAFRSMSFIAIVALIAGPIEARDKKCSYRISKEQAARKTALDNRQ